MTGCGRFAPSVTGEAHPGTLLAGLLAWLDARCGGHRFVLRLEDTDHTRLRPHFASRLMADLAWLGLDWDELSVQSSDRSRHEAALDDLAARGLLYPCRCTRSQRTQGGRRAPDGSVAYDNRCRHRPLKDGSWRNADEPIRLALPDRRVELVDDSGLDLSQTPARDMGDPIVVRRDGVLAYQLVVVVDDAHAKVTRIVRGRDIAPSTATQVLVQELLGHPRPAYRHHFLLLEPRGDKLAKLHGSISAPTLRHHYGPRELLGVLAHAADLLPVPRATSTEELLARFSWDAVRTSDRTMTWTGSQLEV